MCRSIAAFVVLLITIVLCAAAASPPLVAFTTASPATFHSLRSDASAPYAHRFSPMQSTADSLIQCQALSLSTFTLCTNVLGGNTLNVSVCGTTNGWVGFGFRSGSGMAGTSAIVGWNNNAGNTYIGNYDLGNHNYGTTDTSTLQATNLAVTNTNGVTCINFRRPLTVTASSYTVSVNSAMNVACATGNLPSSASPTSLQQHTNRWFGQITLSALYPSSSAAAAVTAVVSSSAAPAPSSSAAPAPSSSAAPAPSSSAATATVAPTAPAASSSSVRTSSSAVPVTSSSTPLASSSSAFVAPTPLVCSTVVYSTNSVSYDLCMNVLGGSTLNASVCSNVNGGWLAMGFRNGAGGGMDGTSAIVGWRNTAGTNSYVGNIDLGYHVVNNVNTATLSASSTSVTYSAATSRTCIAFQRPLVLSSASLSAYNLALDTSMNIVLAQGQLPASSDPNALGQHTSTYPTQVVLSSSSSTGGAGPNTCTLVGNTFTLCVPRINGSTQFNVSFCGNVDGGWLGLGFQSASRRDRMSGALAVVGWSDGGSNTAVNSYQNVDRDPQPSSLLQASNMRVTYNPATSVTCLSFIRPTTLTGAAADASMTSNGDLYIVYAYGSRPSSPSDAFTQHNVANGASLNVYALAATTAVASSGTNYRFIHATLMMLSFGCLFPLAIICPLLLKPLGPTWFHLHRALITAGCVLALAGFGIAVNKFEDAHGANYKSSHRAIGIVVITFMLLQPIVGFLRPHAPSPGEVASAARRVWHLIHRLFGYSVLVLSFANIVIGATTYTDVSATFVIPFALAWPAGIAALYMLWSRAVDGGGKSPSSQGNESLSSVELRRSDAANGTSSE